MSVWKWVWVACEVVWLVNELALMILILRRVNQFTITGQWDAAKGRKQLIQAYVLAAIGMILTPFAKWVF
jgi:hypothetical protein